MTGLFALICLSAVQWQHPAGIVTDATVAEMRQTLSTEEWAQDVYDSQKRLRSIWLDVSSEMLYKTFPTACGNVYHNFSCPTDRCRLVFDPFQCDEFTCPICTRIFPADTDAGIYDKGDRYKGTMYDGWACLYYQTAAQAAWELALMGRVENDDRYYPRAIEILMLYSDTIEDLPTQKDPDPQMSRILTYHREGDNKVLYDLACAYELVRDHMRPEERARFESAVLRRMLDDIILEPIYTYDHNNLYQWHRTVVQTALSLEREDLIDWSFGFGDFSPEKLPEHRSIRRLLATHFKRDGAYWEMCSGYHLYPVTFLCEFAVLSHRLSQMDPVRFPPERYDLTDRNSDGGKVIDGALHWFMSMAMPDRHMPTIGDSPQPLAGMDNYYMTAEVGYRYFDLKEVGDYPAYRAGKRTWMGLVCGVPHIVQSDTPFASSYLSSGWVSLRNAWQGNRIWVGLNGLIPGGGHQHADRLGLLLYSHDTLLALEKATPYNEKTTRVLGTLSPMHNTVTVDMTSQKQGEALQPDEIPVVKYFHAGDRVQFAQLEADNLYPQTRVYRRAVAVVEDIVVDLFRVEGGQTHDWMVQHAGGQPQLSVPMTDNTFEPREWLYNGTQNVKMGKSSDLWTAQWAVGDVTSRLTMAGAPGTELYRLETYPIDNAVITAGHPPCQTLCVRRTHDAPYLAVWDAWRDQPNLQSLAMTDEAGAVLRTRDHVYHLRFGAGESSFEGGATLASDAAFAIVRDEAAAMFVGGTFIHFTSDKGDLHATAPETTTLTVTSGPDGPECKTWPPILYDTYQGIDRPRVVPVLSLRVEGSLWTRTKKEEGYQ